MFLVPILFWSTFPRLRDRVQSWVVGLARLWSKHVWPRPSLLRCQRDQTRILDPAASASAEFSAELECRAEEMTCWPVSPRVGNVKNNDSTLIEPIAA
jgi:hypothetical protein